jgi:anti-anti-sigma factor
MERVLEPEEFRADRARRPERGRDGWRDDAGTGPRVGIVRPGPLASELDVERLRQAITDSFLDGAREVIVDLSGVRSITIDAIGVLLVLHADAQRYGGRVRVENAGHSVRRKLRVTGALGHLV